MLPPVLRTAFSLKIPCLSVPVDCHFSHQFSKVLDAPNAPRAKCRLVSLSSNYLDCDQFSQALESTLGRLRSIWPARNHSFSERRL